MRYSEDGQPGFCIVLKGSCLLAVDGHEPITINVLTIYAQLFGLTREG